MHTTIPLPPIPLKPLHPKERPNPPGYIPKYHSEIEWPEKGIELNTLTHELYECKDEEGEKPPVDVSRDRWSPGMTQWVHDHFDKYVKFEWKERYRHIPFEHLYNTFSTDELYRLAWGDCIQSEISERFEIDPRYYVLDKIRHSMWMWGYGRGHYNAAVRAYNSIRSFDWGLPGFETRLDCGGKFTACGYTVCTNLWIDASFAYLIYKDGELVLKIGFAFSQNGCLVPQIQLAKKKGNRWLFKLPCGVVEYAMQRMLAAFGVVSLVAPDSAVASVARGYKRCPEKFTPEQREHVRKTYAVEFKNLRRGEEFSQSSDGLGMQWFKIEKLPPK